MNSSLASAPSASGFTRSPVDRRLWLRWGVAVLAADVVVHNGLATLGNDWEGWGTFTAVFVFVLVTGLLVVGLTYGLLVRWGLRPSRRGRNRAALAAFAAGIASLLAYVIYFTWAPALVAPAAFLLARVGLDGAAERGGRRMALTGAALGGLSAAMWISMLSYAAVTGEFPFGL